MLGQTTNGGAVVEIVGDSVSYVAGTNDDCDEVYILSGTATQYTWSFSISGLTCIVPMNSVGFTIHGLSCSGYACIGAYKWK